jgi:carbon-monoxide dehydrogenase small subunit
MKPASFDYHVPSTIDEAVELLGQLGDDAKVIAGGQSLVPMLAMRLSVFAHLVDVGRIHELRGVSRRNGSLVVGAATVDVVLEKDPQVAVAVPLLAEVTPMIGHFQIRNRGTVGGSLAHADPAAEYPAVAVALEAQMEVVSARGTRVLPAADFFEGVWTTALEPYELLTATFRCGMVGVASRPRSSHGGTATSRSPARLRGWSSMRTAPSPGPPSPCSAWARRRFAPSRPSGSSSPHWPPRSISGRSAGLLFPTSRRLRATCTPRPHTGPESRERSSLEPGRERSRRRKIPESIVSITVNGHARTALVEPRRTLADFLRENCSQTGTHLGCEHGVCGACTVLLDGEAVRSCLVFAVQAEGAEVTTVEGLAPGDGSLSPVQNAFREAHGLQCGFCTPGFIVSVTAFLRDNPDPSDDEIRVALAGNLCRCTGYQGIIKAVRLAATPSVGAGA